MAQRQQGRHLLALGAAALLAGSAPGERPAAAAPPAPRLVWDFEGESERPSSTLPDSEAIALVSHFGFVEGPPRGPRYLAFDGAGQPRCAVAVESTAAVIPAGRGRVAVLAATTMDLLDERCQVRFSHPAEQAVCLLEGELVAVADEGHVLFLDRRGSTRGSSNLSRSATLIAAADGGHLVAESGSLRVYDPWGRHLARIEPLPDRAVRAVAGGPDRIYLAAASAADGGELLRAYLLDGALAWEEKLEPRLDLIGLWAWPDGRGALVALERHAAPVISGEAAGAPPRAHRLEARDPGGEVRWQLPLTESARPRRVDAGFAASTGDVAITISDSIGALPRAAILVISPGGQVRALLRVTAVIREGGARLSAGGRYLLVNAIDSGRLSLYAVP